MSDIGEKLYPIRVRSPKPMPLIEAPAIPTPVEVPAEPVLVPARRV